MKSRSRKLLDKAVAATVAAIEIYNKPDFKYRGETFCILAINGWELLLKAKWLNDNNNNLRSLYEKEYRKNKDKSRSKKYTIKRSRSGNPLTHSLDYLAKKFVEQGHLEQNAWANIQALLELRDTSIHFYNSSDDFASKLQMLGAASIENFVSLLQEWFDYDLSQFNFFLMPLSFVKLPARTKAIILNNEEKNFLNYLEQLVAETKGGDSKYYVISDINLNLKRSRAKDAPGLRLTSNPDAPEVRMTEEQIHEQFSWDYEKLTDACRKRYSDFKCNSKYHAIRKVICEGENGKLSKTRYLDPKNPKSSKKQFYNPNILKKLDEHYGLTQDQRTPS